MGIGVIGTGHYLPTKVLTNKDLEQMVDTSDEWIRTRTGIEERRIAEDDIDTSDMAFYAAKQALEEAKLSAHEIDLILVATVTPDTAFPSVAAIIQDRLGASNAAAMDISAACSGFMYGLVTAKQFIETKTYKHILIVGVEKLSKITDWEDRNTCILFGDGAGAAVLSEVSEGNGILSFELGARTIRTKFKCEVSEGNGILSFELGADGSGGKNLYQAEKGYLVQNGREVFKFAVRQMPESVINVVKKAGIEKDEVDFLIPHQANIRIMGAARQRLGISE